MKRKLNVGFLLFLVVAVLIIALGTHLLHTLQVDRTARALLEQADQAEASGDRAKAADFVGRYLSSVPQDNDALYRYGLLNTKLADTPRQRAPALALLERVLRREPERNEARLHAIRLSLALESIGDAQEHLKLLGQAGRADCEVMYLNGRCAEGAKRPQEALAHYDQAAVEAKRDPAAYQRLELAERIDFYVRPAHLRMRQVTLALQEKRDLSQQSRRLELRESMGKIVSLLEALGAANADHFQAYLTRLQTWQELSGVWERLAEDPLSRAGDAADAGAWRKEAKQSRLDALDRAKKDLAHAEALARDDAQVILAAADLAQQEGRLNDARERLEQGIIRHHKIVPLYRGAARLEMKDERPERAAVVLRRGLQAVPRNVDLLWDLTDVLIRQKRTDEAQEHLARLRAAGGPPPLADYLEAVILLHEEKWWLAAQALTAVQPRLKDWPDVQTRADLALGRCWEDLGEPDQQYTVYRRVLTADPLSLPATVGAASALVAMNKVEEAIETYHRMLPFAPAVRLEIGRLLLLKTLKTRKSEQRWEEVEEFLAGLPDSSDTKLLKAELLAARNDASRNDLEQAVGILTAARDTDPDKVELWTALANVTDRKAGPQPALAILDEAQRQLKQDLVELRLARARIWLRRTPDEARPALAALAQDVDTFSPGDRRRLLRGLAQAISELRDLAEARKAWIRVAGSNPQDLGARLMLFDLAVLADDPAGARQAQAEIERLQGPEGTFTRLARACALLLEARPDPESDAAKAKLREARSHLAAAAARRPFWSRVRVRQAEVEALLGNLPAAMDHYQEAVLRLGESTPAVVIQSVQLLRQGKREREAATQAIMLKFQDNPLVKESLNRVQVESLLEKGQFAKAADLAESLVKADSKSARDCLWLGRILARAGRPTPAEAALRRAVELDPAFPDARLALVQFLVVVDKKAAAVEALREAQAKLAPDQALTLAHGHEAVGEMKEAEQLYLEAEKSDPAGRSALAGFYLRTMKRPDDAGKLEQAERLLRQVIEESGKTKQEQAWARRALAILLATKKDYQLMREALDILGVLDSAATELGPGAATPENQRLRAILLATRSRRQRLEAIRLLDGLGRYQVPSDRFLLAQLYEVTGDWPKAREKMLGLLADQDDDRAQPVQHLQYLASYCGSLLRRGQIDEAETWLRKLSALDRGDPQMFVTIGLKAKLLKAQKKDAEALTLVQGYAVRRKADAGRVASLLEELGLAAAAEPYYREFVTQSKKPGTELVLAEFLARQQRLAEGLDVCDRAWETCSPESVATATIEMLYMAGATAQQQERAAKRLEAALQKHPDSVTVRSQLAALRNLQGRYKEVITLYRQVLERTPKEAVALNNLAWLLAVSEGQEAEALRTIEQALTIQGPLASLLETRAAIHLVGGRADQAVKDMIDVVNDDPSATAQFHLAQAYLAMGDQARAARSFQEAQTRGFKPGDLHALERSGFDQFVRELASK